MEGPPAFVEDAIIFSPVSLTDAAAAFGHARLVDASPTRLRRSPTPGGSSGDEATLSPPTKKPAEKGEEEEEEEEKEEGRPPSRPGPASPPLSRCRRKLLGLRGPAFDLGAVERGRGADHGVCSAAWCDPLSQITDFLFLGTWRDAANGALLRAHGIAFVLNAARELGEGEKETEKERVAAGVRYHAVPMRDRHDAGGDLNAHLDDAFAFLRAARDAGGRVLVYCRRGVSRSATIVIAYVMAAGGWGYREALDFVRARRRCVAPNLAFHERLAAFTDDPAWYRRRRESCGLEDEPPAEPPAAEPGPEAAGEAARIADVAFRPPPFLFFTLLLSLCVL